MDFNKPLKRLEGFVVYTTLLDYIDTFVHEYSASKSGKEFPSLRETTTMILTLLEDLKRVDISDLKEDKDTNIAEVLETVGQRLADTRKEVEAIEAKMQVLFTEQEFAEHGQQGKKVFWSKEIKAAKETEQAIPFILSGEKDIELLHSWGISEKELSIPKKKRKPKPCE